MMLMIKAHVALPGLASVVNWPLALGLTFSFPGATMADGPRTVEALVCLHIRRQDKPTKVACFGSMPARRGPRTKPVTIERNPSWTFETNDKLAKKFGMPFVRMRIKQILRLLEGEEVKDECAHRRRVAELIVQDECVTWSEHTVRFLGKAREFVDSVIS